MAGGLTASEIKPSNVGRADFVRLLDTWQSSLHRILQMLADDSSNRFSEEAWLLDEELNTLYEAFLASGNEQHAMMGSKLIDDRFHQLLSDLSALSQLH